MNSRPSMVRVARITNPNARLSRFVASTTVALAIMLVAATAAFAAPTISISNGPAEGARTNASSISYLLSAPGENRKTDFYCALNSYSFDPCDLVSYPVCLPLSGLGLCSQPKVYDALTEGTHQFRAQAITCSDDCDIPGPVEFGPVVTRTFVIDRTPPVVTVRYPFPGLKFKSTTPVTLDLSINEQVTINCGLDGKPLIPCANPHTFKPLKSGAHTISAQATDLAGNVSQTASTTIIVSAAKVKAKTKCKKAKAQSKKSASSKSKKCKKAKAKKRKH